MGHSQADIDLQHGHVIIPPIYLEIYMEFYVINVLAVYPQTALISVGRPSLFALWWKLAYSMKHWFDLPSPVTKTQFTKLAAPFYHTF